MNRFTDAAEITGTRRTADGYLIADIRCARTGVQQYRASEIGLTGDAAIGVYRPEEAVFAKDSLATYAHKPVTVQHPPQAVTADNWREYAVGDIGEEVARDGDFVRVSIKVMDAAAIKAIEAGTREVSMGYVTPVLAQDGTAPDGTPYAAVQTGPIRINHLALVDRARGGKELRIGDGVEGWGAAPITNDHSKKGTAMADLRTILVDGLSVETTDAGAQAITKLQDALKGAQTTHDAKVEGLEGTIATMTKDAEAKDGKIAALQKALDAATSPAAIADAAKKRADAMAAGKKAGYSEEDMAEMDDAAIRRAVVVKSLGDSAKDMTDAAVDGAFAVIRAQVKVGDEALGGGIKTQVADAWAAFTPKKEG